MIEMALTGAAVLLTLMAVLWAVSVFVKDASIVDSVWGLTFFVQALTFTVVASDISIRSGIVLGLVGLWSVRLSWHIFSRNHGNGEDYRYKAMREEHGTSKFWWYSFFSVFMLQGVLSIIVAAPLLFVISDSGSEFAMLDVIACILFAVGFYFEAIGDLQLLRFKKDPANKGKLLTTGLWSLTRHPNYFGDIVMWWSLFIFALSADAGWISFYGPLVMTLFIYNISGVKLLEKDLIKKKPDYEEYIKSTPAFVPKISKLFGGS